MGKNTEEGYYEVETIMGKTKLKGKTVYLVKWKGFSGNESTWEPLSNLKGV